MRIDISVLSGIALFAAASLGGLLVSFGAASAAGSSYVDFICYLGAGISGAVLYALLRVAATTPGNPQVAARSQRFSRPENVDGLTGLPNRQAYQARLAEALRAATYGHKVAVASINIDRFTIVNESLGRAQGDKLLLKIAARLRETLRAGDIVARLGGDDFGLILLHVDTPLAAGMVAEKVLEALTEGFDLGDQEAFATASVGISLFPSDGNTAAELMKAADTALYRAKELGKNNYQFYTPEMNRRSIKQLQLEISLRHALEREEFAIHFQPRVDIFTRRIVGAEALLRWRPAPDKLVPPVQFIPVLEATGLIVPVGEWILESVASRLRAWADGGLRTVPIAVNVSPRQFQRSDLCQRIRSCLEQAQVPAEMLELEVTESLLMNHEEQAQRTLGQLRALGVRLSLDDFGTGYSSLCYLKRFPFDALKIDKSFIRDIYTDASDAALTLAIISMAHSLKLRVVAEGIETEEQLTYLAENRCDEGQGFLFYRPLPEAEFAKLLEGADAASLEELVPQFAP